MRNVCLLITLLAATSIALGDQLESERVKTEKTVVQPTTLSVTDAVRIEDQLIGVEGAFWVEEYSDPQGHVTHSVFVQSGEKDWIVDEFTIAAEEDRFGPLGTTWSGVIDGEQVQGTIRASLDEPYTEIVLEMVQLDQDGNAVTNVSVTSQSSDFSRTISPAAVWPYKSYCGCDSLNTLCASTADCTVSLGCPSGSTDVCHWIIIFDPWFMAAAARPEFTGEQLVGDALSR